VSVGYRIHKTEVDEKTEVYTVRKWSPLEVSLVSIPADKTVGVGRSTSELKPQEVTMTQEVDIERVRAEAVAEAERKFKGDAAKEAAELTERAVAEATAIYDLGAKHAMSDAAREFVKNGKSLSEFRGHVLDKIGDKPLENMDIGMSKREIEQFSVMRLIRAKNGNRSDIDRAAMEIEACSAAADALGGDVKTRGFRMPTEVMDTWMKVGQRDLAAGVDTQIIPTDYRPGSFIYALRNASSVMRAGPTMLTGLAGNVDIPAENAVSTAAWISSEGGNATESEGTFRTVSLTPNDVSMYTDMTRRMIQQSSPDIEAIVRRQITLAIALKIDAAALEGSGTSGEPEGILNTSGINKPTAFAAADPTWAEVVAMETAVADDNALMGNLAYIGRTNMRGALKTTKKDAGSGMFVLEGNEVNGYPYIASNQGTDGNLYFGNWSDLLIGMWGGLDLVVDDSALALSGGRRLIAFQTIDCAVRHAESFCYNNDT